MDRIVLAGAVRTPVGKMGGSLSEVPAKELGAIVIKESLRRCGVALEQVDEVLFGCVLQAGLGQNVARQASLAAGLPYTVPAMTLNIVCGSGLQAVNLAASRILAGEADVVAAGGCENMSMAPFLLEKARFGYRMNDGTLVDEMIRDALSDAMNGIHMGITAENVAEKWKITREELDAFSAESQNKAVRAVREGRFKDEIVPVPVKRKKETFLFDTDEGPRDGVTKESLARLRPAFKEDGVVTAGNSSGINDGAAAVLVLRESRAKELGVKPMAYWKAGALGGVDPLIMGTGPIPAVRKILQRTGLSIGDFDLIEANEAFAAQSIAVIRDLEIPKDRLNVNGGAIALGHPVGASGCRILVTLLHEMEKRNVKRGLATLCIGGGMGCAAVVERE